MYSYLYFAVSVEGYVGGGLIEAGNLGLNQRERAASLPGLQPVFSSCMLATSAPCTGHSAQGTVQRLLLCTRATGSRPQSKTFTERQRGWRGVKVEQGGAGGR